MEYEIKSIDDLEQMLKQKKKTDHDLHLLLGNGFSISYSSYFSYSSLFEIAKNLLTPRLNEIFQYLGTNNFEGVLKYLRSLLDINQIYFREYLKRIATEKRDLQKSALLEIFIEKFMKECQEDLEQLKRGLVEAITKIHPPYERFSQRNLEQENYKLNNDLPWRSFLKQFNSIFTTNYDLLLYWIILGKNMTQELGDGFSKSLSKEGCLEWSELGYTRKTSVYYLHGALHFFEDQQGRIFKRTSRSTVKLLEQIQKGIQTKKFPLFVAEGRPEQKKGQIQSNRYLLHCYHKLQNEIQGTLIIYGQALGDSDDHILEAICQNKKIREIWLGMFRHQQDLEQKKRLQLLFDRISEKRTASHSRAPLQIYLYDTESKNLWGQYSQNKQDKITSNALAKKALITQQLLNKQTLKQNA